MRKDMSLEASWHCKTSRRLTSDHLRFGPMLKHRPQTKLLKRLPVLPRWRELLLGSHAARHPGTPDSRRTRCWRWPFSAYAGELRVMGQRRFTSAALLEFGRCKAQDERLHPL